MKKLPSDVDRHIGLKVRARRLEAGLSQERLGLALGVTFQQVQKYEKGSNRMGASRLQQAALALGVPVSHFYEGAPINGFVDTGGAFFESQISTEESALLVAFRRIDDPRLRKRVQQLLETMTAE